MSHNVDALDSLVEGALSGNILDDRPLELALLELAGVLLLPRIRLVLRADGTANSAESRERPRGGTFGQPQFRGPADLGVSAYRKPFCRNWRVTSVPTKPGDRDPTASACRSGLRRPLDGEQKRLTGGARDEDELGRHDMYLLSCSHECGMWKGESEAASPSPAAHQDFGHGGDVADKRLPRVSEISDKIIQISCSCSRQQLGICI